MNRRNFKGHRKSEALNTPEGQFRNFMRDARLNRSSALDTILRAFQSQPDRQFRAVDFTTEENILPGSVYPILQKLVRANCLAVHRVGHPSPASLKTYSLTNGGAHFALRYFATRMGAQT
jgi:hypothetical protein